jgi:hypothetical protein
MAYLLGYRMERDTGHAIKLLKESAVAHDKFALDAAEQLGKIYEQGLLGSFPVDYNEALSWRQRGRPNAHTLSGSWRRTGGSGRTLPASGN